MVTSVNMDYTSVNFFMRGLNLNVFHEKIRFLIQNEQTMQEFIFSCSKSRNLADFKNCGIMHFLNSISGYLNEDHLLDEKSDFFTSCIENKSRWLFKFFSDKESQKMDCYFEQLYAMGQMILRRLILLTFAKNTRLYTMWRWKLSAWILPKHFMDVSSKTNISFKKKKDVFIDHRLEW